MIYKLLNKNIFNKINFIDNNVYTYLILQFYKIEYFNIKADYVI